MSTPSRRKKVLTRRAIPTTLVPPLDSPRRYRDTVLDFRTLHLPRDVAAVISDAFWHRLGARRLQTIFDHWARIRFFGRFNEETRALRGLADLKGDILLRYVEWLNTQKTAQGSPLSKATRASTYISLRKLLQWLARCRPGLLGHIVWPVNPFPWRNRDTRARRGITASHLREILQACEQDIAKMRAMRARGLELRRSAAAAGATYRTHLGAVLDFIDTEFGGVLPTTTVLYRTHNHFYHHLTVHGGVFEIEPYLYPNAHGLFPYYLAIVLHTAGNSQAVAEMALDCLRPIPLLDDREVLLWDKPRAGTVQRRSFRTSAPFEPPALVREVIDWTQRLRPRLTLGERKQLFVMKTVYGPMAATRIKFEGPRLRFIAEHKLTPFVMGSLRPGVLTALYRSTGDLRAVKTAANHASISTTATYVQGPEVAAQHGLRMAALQSAWLGHIEPTAEVESTTRPSEAQPEQVPPGTAVSMFGFSCKDPLSGLAPGTRAGALCTNFLACLTCPNAIIPTDAPTLARLLHAREHLRAAAVHIHPARWAAIYAPQLRILDEDLLPRFPSRERVEAERLRMTLKPLLPLR